mgnify:CR=1 FL=1
MEGRLLARARAKQETLRAENRAEEDRRRREIAAKIPEIGRIDTALCANLSEMVRVAMRQCARTAQELEKESLALQEKRSALLVQHGYPKDYLDPIYSCPRCRDTGWTDGRICECVQKLYRAEQTRELAPLLKQGDETFENFRLDYYSPVAPASGVSPRAQMERVLRLCRAYAESFARSRRICCSPASQDWGKRSSPPPSRASWPQRAAAWRTIRRAGFSPRSSARNSPAIRTRYRTPPRACASL